MAVTIKPKRGAENPVRNTLTNGEIGYGSNENCIFIGNASGTPVAVNGIHIGGSAPTEIGYKLWVDTSVPIYGTTFPSNPSQGQIFFKLLQ